MWQILHASFWKYSELSNSGISLNWSIVDEITTRNTTASFVSHSVGVVLHGHTTVTAAVRVRVQGRGPFYDPRMQRGNVFDRIYLYVCLSVCLSVCNALFRKPWLI